MRMPGCHLQLFPDCSGELVVRLVNEDQRRESAAEALQAVAFPIIKKFEFESGDELVGILDDPKRYSHVEAG